VAVPVDRMGSASPGRAKTSSLGRKWFRDRLVAAPEKKVKRPAGLKTRPAWLRQDRLCVNPGVCTALRADWLGFRSRQGLEVADGDDLVPGPDSDGEREGSAAQNGIGAIVERLE
jgi:hypothetical protein